MANEISKRDQNSVPVLTGVTDNANLEIRMLRVNPVTGRLQVSASGGVGAWSTPPETVFSNGSVTDFTVGSTAPTDVVSDGYMRFLGIDYTYDSISKISFMTAPISYVRYR